MMRVVVGFLLLLTSAASAAPAAVGTVQAWDFKAGRLSVKYPFGSSAITQAHDVRRALFLPKPESGLPDFEPGEEVEVVRDGQRLLVRRLDALRRRVNAAMRDLSPDDRKTVERMLEWRRRQTVGENTRLDPAELKTGQLGRVEGGVLVVHIYDGSTMLVDPSNAGSLTSISIQAFILKGLPTADLVEGKRIKIDDVLAVKGTSRAYQNLSRSVFELLAEPGSDVILAQDLAVLQRFEKPLNDRMAAELKEQRQASAPAPIAGDVAARAKLKLAQQLIADGKREAAEFRLEQLIRDYPDTPAAGEARELLGVPAKR